MPPTVLTTVVTRADGTRHHLSTRSLAVAVLSTEVTHTTATHHAAIVVAGSPQRCNPCGLNLKSAAETLSAFNSRCWKVVPVVARGSPPYW